MQTLKTPRRSIPSPATMRRLLSACLAAGLALLAASCSDSGGARDARQIRHVFVITLENKDYDDTFGTSTQDPYLTKTLRPMGAMLTRYYGTGHVSLDNYISMISGQASSLATQHDCMSFDDFALTGMTADGQAIGNGCVYPANVRTLPDQLRAHHLSWRGYMEDMGNDPARESATCGHAAIGSRDPTQSAEAPSAAVPAGDFYAARHDPFVYFHSIIDSPECQANVVNLARLDADLADATTTPNFAFITPNLCNDGHDGDGTGAPGKGCVNGKPGGLASADEFLKTWVPKILASPAYQRDGLLIITFDESNYSVNSHSKDAAGVTTIELAFRGESCCGQQPGPNVVRPLEDQFAASPQLQVRLRVEGIGGDRIGALMISPFIKPGTVSDQPYNHYALLKTLENLFQLDGYLGYAGQPGLVAIGDDVFNN